MIIDCTLGVVVKFQKNIYNGKEIVLVAIGKEKAKSVEALYQAQDNNDKNFATHPKMRAPEITEDLLKVIPEGKYDFVLVNYSNPDMIGHTGDFEAAKEAVAYCDECVGKIAKATLESSVTITKLIDIERGMEKKIKDKKKEERE